PPAGARPPLAVHRDGGAVRFLHGHAPLLGGGPADRPLPGRGGGPGGTGPLTSGAALSDERLPLGPAGGWVGRTGRLKGFPLAEEGLPRTFGARHWRALFIGQEQES